MPSPLKSPQEAHFRFRGLVGERIHANQEAWLLTAPGANPALLQMFRDRDRHPRRALMPWSGEFPGKYLTSAVLSYRLTRDKRLLSHLEGFVAELRATQDEDGYLGPHPRAERLTGKTHDGRSDLWDLWGHYHCLLGLLAWHEETGEEGALDTARRAADLVCARFLDTGKRAISAGAEEMNLALAHGLLLLHRVTGTERYLRMAREIERDWETPPAGDYVRTALAGQEFYRTPKPRWESLHDVLAIGELYRVTGDDRYLRALTHIWRSIRRTDRHNTGAFSSGEGAVGNPYDPRPIETCCVVAWMALTLDVLRLTGDPAAADELELSTFNAVLGAQHPSGRWWTYNTPMNGVRKASAHDIVFQAHEGAPELNCCSVNGPRALGMLADWAFMGCEDGVTVNYYGPCSVHLRLPDGGMLRLTQSTDYPIRHGVKLRLGLEHSRRFTLRLRIPAWTLAPGPGYRGASYTVKGEGPRTAPGGDYLTLDREWRDGDTVRLNLNPAVHYWPGEREFAGQVSIYRGPLLLAYDRRLNDMDADGIPDPTDSRLFVLPVPATEASGTWFAADVQSLTQLTSPQRLVRLCDFASAGSAGTPYRTWLPRGLAGPRMEENLSPFAVKLG